jgi:ubiquinone biosynthesis protein COQ4
MIEAAHPVAWYARRLSDVHDIWHTMTGYSTDALGEASLLAFTYAQTRNRAIAFIVLAAVNEFRKTGYKHPYGRAILEGYRNGRKAKQLIDEDYLSLFGEPVASVRARLGIDEPKIYLSIPKDARNAYGDIMVPPGV